MTESFVEALQSAKLVFDARDALDALWLARLMPGREGGATRLDAAAPLPGVGAVEMTPAGAATPPVDLAQPPEKPPPEPKPAPSQGSVLPSVAPASEGEPVVPATPIRIPAGTALPEGLEIVRSMRAIPARLPSRTLRELDEEATVEATASREGKLTPVFRPCAERWYEAAIVVEQTPSMDVWAQTVIEIERMLAYLGSFRDVRTWWLHCTPEPHLVAESGAVLGVDSLRDPVARRIVFLFSHCVSRAWLDGSMTQIIERWGRTTPVVLLHALPRRMWKQTPVGEPSGIAWNASPGGPNGELRFARSGWRLRNEDVRFPLPVFSLEPAMAGRWADMLMARRGQTSPAYLLRREASPPPTARQMALSAEQKVEAFRANASAEAFRLAVHLAAGPLTVPVIHLVQTALFGDRASHSFVAEVMLSGLVERVTPVNARVPPENVQFRFQAEARKVLLRSLRRDDAVALGRSVQNYIERQFDNPNDFQSWLQDPQGKTMIPASAEPFAQLRAGFLELLGVQKLSAPRPEPVEGKKSRPEVVALVIGVGSYRGQPDWQMPGAAHAAYEFSQYLREQGVPAENIRLMAPDFTLLNATIASMLEIQARHLIVFWSGRGGMSGGQPDWVHGRLGEPISFRSIKTALSKIDTEWRTFIADLGESWLRSRPGEQYHVVAPPVGGAVDAWKTELYGAAAFKDGPQHLWPALLALIQSEPDLLFDDPDAFAAKMRETVAPRAPARRRIYFDYSLEDRELSTLLLHALRQAGHEVFEPDIDRFSYGTDVERELRLADVFLTVRNVGTDEKLWKWSEVEDARKQGLPILVATSKPDAMRSGAFLTVPFTGVPWARQFQELLRLIEAAASGRTGQQSADVTALLVVLHEYGPSRNFDLFHAQKTAADLARRLETAGVRRIVTLSPDAMQLRQWIDRMRDSPGSLLIVYWIGRGDRSHAFPQWVHLRGEAPGATQGLRVQVLLNSINRLPFERKVLFLDIEESWVATTQEPITALSGLSEHVPSDTLVIAPGRTGQIWPLLRGLSNERFARLLQDPFDIAERLRQQGAFVHATMDSVRTAEPRGAPDWDDLFESQTEQKESILAAVRDRRVAIVSGTGRMRLCFSVVRDLQARRYFTGGIWWEPKPGDLPGKGRRLYVTSTLVFASLAREPLPEEHWLLYRPASAIEDHEGGNWPEFAVPPLDERGLVTFFSRLPREVKLRHLHELAPLHENRLEVLDYLHSLFGLFDPELVLEWLLRLQSELIATPYERRVEAILDRVTFAILPNRFWLGLRLISIAAGEELPLELLAALQIPTHDMRRLGLTRQAGLSIRLAEMAKAKVAAEPFDARDLHRMLVEAMHKTYGSDEESWRKSTYLRNGMVHHLIGAGDTAAAVQWMGNFRWLVVRGEADGVDGLLSDAERLQRVDRRGAAMFGVLLRAREELTGASPFAHALARVIVRDLHSYPEWGNLLRQASGWLGSESGPQHWVLVAGTGNRLLYRNVEKRVAVAVGAALARAEFGLITGGWPGVDKDAAKAYAEASRRHVQPLEMRLIQVVEGHSKASFDGGSIARVERGRSIEEALRLAHAVVIIGGRDGTERVAHLAERMGKPVIPVGGSGRAAAELFAEAVERGTKREGSRLALDPELKGNAEKIAEAVVEHVRGALRRRPLSEGDAEQC